MRGREEAVKLHLRLVRGLDPDPIMVIGERGVEVLEEGVRLMEMIGEYEVEYSPRIEDLFIIHFQTVEGR